MKTSHGKSCNRTVLFLRLHAVIAFDKPDDVFKSTFVGAIHGFRDHKLRLVEVFTSLTRCSILNHVAIWHHHHHRLGFARSNQVVQNLSSSSQIDPGFLISSSSVQEVENRVTFLGGFIPRRGVDRDASIHVQAWGIVPSTAHRAVRNIVGLVQVALASAD